MMSGVMGVKYGELCMSIGSRIILAQYMTVSNVSAKFVLYLRRQEYPTNHSHEFIDVHFFSYFSP